MKAKTKTSLLSIILVAILGVVFAFSYGYTYASINFGLNVGSNVYSTTTSIAKQNYAVINDTLSTPVSYSDGNHLREVSIEYSYSYSFDMRVSYSLVWTNAGSARTDNVILNYPLRDSLILDKEYMYYKDTVSAGSGKINLISGIQFSDSDNSAYIGATLKIIINEVKIVKSAETYSTVSALYTTSTSGIAWLRYKNNSNYDNAYVIIYNSHTNINNGVSHPGVATAYSRTIATGNVVSNARWLGGNRSYGGLEIYIITGNQPYNLSLSVSGAWQNNQGESGAQIVINNIKMNYADGWNIVAKDGPVFDRCEYKYTIPANSAVYIKVLDSIEITSAGHLTTSDYTGYVVTTSLSINNSSFTSSMFVNGIQSGQINQPVSMQTSPSSYSSSAIRIANTTQYKSGLYNTYVGGQQSFEGAVMLINNTAESRNVAVNFKLRCYISNGLNVLFNQSGDTYIYGASFTNGSLWYRDVIELSSGFTISVNDNQFTITGSNANMLRSLSAYSSMSVIKNYSVSIDSSIIASYGNYDVWVELVPTISSSAVTSSTALPELIMNTVYSSGNTILTMSVKNNYTQKISGVSVTPTVYELITNSPERLWAQPNDWVSNYWQYYYLSGGVYVKNNSSTWAAGNEYYSITYTKTPLAISLTRQNGFTLSGSTYQSSIELAPGESAIIGTVTISSEKKLSVEYTSQATAYISTQQISLINENTSLAYIKNDTANSYYVRFTGNLAVSGSLFTTTGGYNYYVGIVRPRQVIAVNMSSGTTSIGLEVIQTTSVYTSTTLSAWGSTVQQIFENYFKNS